MLINVSQEEFDDFMSEADTEPYVDLGIVQRQLDSAESVVAQLTGRAQALGYSVDPPKNWMERLELELGDDPIPVDVAMLVEDRQ